MRKVKFTEDSFDEKLGAILEEFPMLDVSILSRSWMKLRSLIKKLLGSTPIPGLAHERSVRQEPLQTGLGTTSYCKTFDRPGCKRLRPSDQVWRQSVSV